MPQHADDRERVRFAVNGEPVDVAVSPDRVLLEVLRDDLRLSGTKEGCLVGVCGLCTVLVDGAVMTACLLPAVKVAGRSVTTIEGIAAADGTLSAVQTAFIERGGFQCGICTPGQIMAATALLAECPHPTEAEVRDWMTGNLCRCTGYYGIVDAVLAAADAQPGDAAGPAARESTGRHPSIRPPIEEVAADTVADAAS
jgi:carbon-monoxide dehydrogenase small subunit